MKQLDQAIDTLEIAVSLLEEATAPRAKDSNANASRKKPTAKSATPNMDSLFSPAELTDVKARLDEAIERLESALEVADGPR